MIEFEWDEENINHVALHNVTQAEVEEVFYRPNFTQPDYTPANESRWRAHGTTKNWRFLTVPYAEREQRIRPITAWDMLRKDKKNMPRISTQQKSKAPRRRSRTAEGETERADWLASPAAKRAATRRFQKAMLEGKILINEQRTVSPELKEQARRTGAVIFNKDGLAVKPTDPSTLEALAAEARASMTKAISLRLPIGGLEAAKALATKTGMGYQTVLKELIHEGLQRAR